jgi:hypothetical protein
VQGRICDAEDHWLNVALAVRLLQSRWRWVGLTACLWLPLAVYAVLRVPPDACTEASCLPVPRVTTPSPEP